MMPARRETAAAAQLHLDPQLYDSSVLVSAFTSAEGASRQVLRRLLKSEAEALISLPLFAEYMVCP